MTTATPTAPAVLPEVVVNDMGPLRHMYRVRPGATIHAGERAVCGSVARSSVVGQVERPARLCAVCVRFADLIGVGA